MLFSCYRPSIGPTPILIAISSARNVEPGLNIERVHQADHLGHHQQQQQFRPVYGRCARVVVVIAIHQNIPNILILNISI